MNRYSLSKFHLGSLSLKPWTFLGVFWALLAINASLAESPQKPTAFNAPPPLPEKFKNAKVPELPDNLPDPKVLINELKQLDKLLGLSDEELDKLIKTINTVKKMSPEKRLTMQLRISKITRLTPVLKTEIDRMIRDFQISDRKSFTQFWLAFDDSARQKLRDQLSGLSAKESKKIITEEYDKFLILRAEAFKAIDK